MRPWVCWGCFDVHSESLVCAEGAHSQLSATQWLHLSSKVNTGGGGGPFSNAKAPSALHLVWQWTNSDSKALTVRWRSIVVPSTHLGKWMSRVAVEQGTSRAYLSCKCDTCDLRVLDRCQASSIWNVTRWHWPSLNMLPKWIVHKKLPRSLVSIVLFLFTLIPTCPNMMNWFPLHLQTKKLKQNSNKTNILKCS